MARIRNSIILIGACVTALYLLSHIVENSGKNTDEENIPDIVSAEAENASDNVSAEMGNASDNVNEGAAENGQDSGTDGAETAQTYKGYLDIGLSISQNGDARRIKLYLDGEDAYYFLPSYASISGNGSNCTFQWNFDEDVYRVALDGVKVKDGDILKMNASPNMARLELEQHSAEKGNWEKTAYELTFMSSENLPCIYIDTYNGTMEYVNSVKGNKEPGTLTCILADGSLDASGDFSAVHVRGATSAGAAKKSYRINFNKNINLLSMGGGTGWVLQANAYDSTNIRNKLCYDLARDLEIPNAVDSEYADTYFNGEYGGAYLLCEPVEVNENRVDIMGNGSFLFEINSLGRLEQDAQYFYDDYGILFEIRYPKDVMLTDEEKEELSNFMNKVEALLDECADDRAYRELHQYIDMDSFASMYLLDQLTDEVDLNGLSTFYYIDGTDGKLRAGPAWDYDRSFGNEPNRDSYVKLNSFGSGFPEQLAANPHFQSLVRKKLNQYQEVIGALQEKVDIYSDTIKTSVKMDRILWGKTNGGFVDSGDFATDVSYLKWYVNERASLISDTVLHPEDYHKVYIDNERNGRLYWARDGEAIPASVISKICALYGCTALTLENGCPIWDGYPILSDLILYTNGNTVSTPNAADAPKDTDGEIASAGYTVQSEPTQGKGILAWMEDFGMNILILLIFAAPGLISLFLMKEFDETAKRKIPMLAVKYVVCEFLILLFTYGSLTLLKGNTTISLSPSYVDTYYTIYDNNAVFGFMLLELIGAVLLACARNLYGKWKKRKAESEEDSNIS